jgi:tRNA-Thr(GGU) m(6)t(6)A37 methyltransferase TsaA
MTVKTCTYQPIGVVRSEHREAEKTPIQPVYAKGCKGCVEIFPEFAEGLRDLEGFSHIYLIYHFHQSRQVKLRVKPFLQDVDRGIFSTRAPFRPNPIGLSVVELKTNKEMFCMWRAWTFWTGRRYWTSSPIRKSLTGLIYGAAAGRTT